VSLSEFAETLGSILGILVSYSATFWLLLAPHNRTALVITGWMSAVYCSLGVGAFFWAKIFAHVARKRLWSRQDCMYPPLLIVIPGCVLFLAGGSILFTINLLLYQSIFTRFRLISLVHSNTDNDAPFQKVLPATKIPR
jgi:hypothetical protein